MFEAPEPAELTSLLVGYDVTDLIAVGGMGAVYRAQQISLNRAVAIKVLPRELSQIEEFEKGFRSEAKAMARLHHPNLIGIYDFGEVDGFLYLIMDFVDGKSLFHYAHGKAIDQKEAARLAYAICDGVAHAHEAGIIHRDIKPANILLDSKKQPRIGDFGLARPIDGSEGDGMHFGTPEYTAPEVMKSPAAANKRSDVFAIGVLLYELLTGELPGENYVPPSQIQKVDSRFDNIVRRAIHPAPAMRFADAGEMAKELESLKTSLADPGSKLVTKGADTGSSPSKLRSSGRTAGPDPAPAALAQAASEAHKRSLIRNLIIIAVLLVVIMIVWGAYGRKKDDIAQITEQAEWDKAVQESMKSPFTPSRQPAQSKPDRPIRRDPPKPTLPEKLTLSGLQQSLALGIRTQFPAGTWDLGDKKAYLVKNRMGWQEACKFAEEHGGHLATITDEAAKATIGSNIPENSTIWLGGGLTGPSTWGWIDGSPWTLPAIPSNSGNRYLRMTSSGTIEAESGQSRHPFVILWHPSGDNPGTLEAQLERLKNSLAQPDPLYLPGTLSYKTRRYLIMEEAVGWEEAAQRARKSGGYLAVPSDDAENKSLHKALTAILPQGSAAWIGGRFQKGSWTWTTGEPWTFAAWSPKPPHALRSDHTAVRMTCGANGGWDNVDPEREDIAAAFVIEWSKDHITSGSSTPAASLLNLADLKMKVAASIAGKRAKHAKLILNNGTAMKRDLVGWLNHGLRHRKRARYWKQIELTRGTVLNTGRIDEQKPFPALPADISDTRDRHLANQQKLDAQIEKSMENDRARLLQILNKALETAQTDRILDQLGILGEEIEAIGENTETFFEYLSLEE